MSSTSLFSINNENENQNTEQNGNSHDCSLTSTILNTMNDHDVFLTEIVQKAVQDGDLKSTDVGFFKDIIERGISMDCLDSSDGLTEKLREMYSEDVVDRCIRFINRKVLEGEDEMLFGQDRDKAKAAFQDVLDSGPQGFKSMSIWRDIQFNDENMKTVFAQNYLRLFLQELHALKRTEFDRIRILSWIRELTSIDDEKRIDLLNHFEGSYLQQDHVYPMVPQEIDSTEQKKKKKNSNETEDGNPLAGLFEDVSKSFKGKIIYIRSCKNSNWVSAGGDTPNSPVICNGEKMSEREELTVSLSRDGYCSFRNHEQKYLSVRQDCHDKRCRLPLTKEMMDSYEDVAPLVFAVADKPQEREMFQIYRYCDHYAIRSVYKKMWLGCWTGDLGGNDEFAAAFAGQLMDGESILIDICDNDQPLIEKWKINKGSKQSFVSSKELLDQTERRGDTVVLGGIEWLVRIEDGYICLMSKYVLGFGKYDQLLESFINKWFDSIDGKIIGQVVDISCPGRALLLNWLGEKSKMRAAYLCKNPYVGKGEKPGFATYWAKDYAGNICVINTDGQMVESEDDYAGIRPVVKLDISI